jgi:hypothetical protein
LVWVANRGRASIEKCLPPVLLIDWAPVADQLFLHGEIMTQAAGVIIFGGAGLCAVLAFHRTVVRLPSAWRWVLGLLIPSIFWLLKFLLRPHLGGGSGYYFLAFYGSGLLASALIEIRAKKSHGK